MLIRAPTFQRVDLRTLWAHTSDGWKQPWRPNPGSQADFVYDDTSEVIGVKTGNRWGKTHMAARKMIRATMKNAVPSLHVAPTYSHLSTTSVPAIMQASREANLRPHWLKVDRVILLRAMKSSYGEYGCPYIILRSANDSLGIANFDAAYIWGDEYAIWQTDAENPENDATIQTPTRLSLEAPINQIVYTGTPQGIDTPMERDFVECSSHEGGVLPQGWVLYEGSTYENERNLRKGYIPSLLKAIPRHMARQIIEGHAVQPGIARAYYEHGDWNIDDDLGYQPNLPLVLCCDFNVQPLVFVVCQFEGRGDKFRGFAINEFVMPDDGNVRVNARRFAEAYKSVHHGDVFITGDPQGAARTVTSKELPYAQIKAEVAEVFGPDRVRLIARHRHIPQATRLAKMNAVLHSAAENEDEAVRFHYNSKKCVELHKDWLGVKMQGEKILKKTTGPYARRTHASDGVAEWVSDMIPDYSEFPLPVTGRPMQHQSKRRRTKSRRSRR